MINDKPKGKAHPFAGHLRSTEKVLWMAGESGLTFDVFARANGIRIVAVVVVIFVAILSSTGSRPFNLSTLFTPSTVIMIVAAAAVLLVFLGRWMWRYTRQPRRTYAITNERLLYRRGQEVFSIPLEVVPTASVFAGSSGRGTLSFGAFFPMWTEVDNAANVKRMIDEAQRKRMKEMAQ